MASRDYLKHVVSTSEPVGSTLGDQWYNPATNTLSARLAVNGTSVTWVQTYPSAGQSAGLQNFTDAISIATPNATVPAASLTATNNSYANIDVVVAAKGTGAIIAAVPDGTAAGGDKRGIYAVDFQRARSGSFQVASGAYSVVSGGQNNYATQQYAVVTGGVNNQASGSHSFIGTGENNSTSGQYSAVISGTQNLANSDQSVVVSGYYANTRSMIGYVVLGTGRLPFGTGSSGNSFSQVGVMVLARATSDATPISLVANNQSPNSQNQIALPANSAYYVTGSVIATVTGGGNTKAWSFEVVVKKGASNATTSIVGTAIINVTAANAGTSTWLIALTADTTNGALTVTATGQVGTSIRWVCRAETTEVTF